MSATDELLTILKEHGVEHYEHQAPATDCIAFFDGNGWHDCWESVDGEVNVTFSMTPEQAVAATLGRGECKVDVLNTGDCAGYECSEYIMHCNGCGHEFGHVLYNEDGDVWMSEPPNYCPNCGRRVVDPTTNDVDAEVADG
jgi:DNA-directed RNA polymerase subunit RPC12/RpoP